MDGIFEIGVVEILYISLFLFWMVYLYFVKDYGYWEQRNVPHVPAGFPFGSKNKALLGKVYSGATIDPAYRAFPKERYVGYNELRNPGLLVRDPELIKLILKKDFNHFTDHGYFDVNRKDYMMNNLFFMKGEEWKSMRFKLTPAYTAAKVKMMYLLVKRCSDLLRGVLDKRIQKNTVIDVKDVFSRYIIDIIGACAFGIDIDSLSNNDSEFYRMSRNISSVGFVTFVKRYLYFAFPIFSKWHVFDMLDSNVSSFFSSIIRSTVEHREMNNITRNDFLDLLIKLKQNKSILEEGEKPENFDDMTAKAINKQGLTMEEISAETFLFFSAGYETTSNTTMFSLYELACNGKVQDRLYREVQEVLERHGGDLSYQALQEMTYMDQVIDETMRRYPSFSFLMRRCIQNYKIPNSSLEIEKGMKIVIPVYSLHHDPKYFPDPYTFDPERFSLENVKKRDPYVFLPFGEGPRKCIGFRFGLMNMKTALATVISDYVVSLAEDTDVPLQLNDSAGMTVPTKPINLVFNRRQEKSRVENKSG